MPVDVSFEQFAAVFAKALDEQNGCRIRNLSPASRVCHEGGIAGDDFPELLDRITAIYGTDFSDIPEYGGPEAVPMGPIAWVTATWKMLRGHQDPDVTLSELHEAVKAGSWKSAFPDRCDPLP
jgi:hypothetical protein